MDYQAIAKWALSARVGLSSRCLALTLMGEKSDGDWPRDGGAFGRCEALLEAVPEFRDRLPEMAKVNAYWAAIAPRWQEIRKASDKYELIKSITRPIEQNDKFVVRLSDTTSIRFGA